MTVGIELFNSSSNNKIIDESFKNYILVEKMVVNTSGAGVIGVNMTYPAGLAVNRPVVALHSPYRGMTLYGVQRPLTGSTITIRLMGSEQPHSPALPVETTEIYVFDLIPNTSTATSGIQIFNPANNELVYCASHKYLKIVPHTYAVTNPSAAMTQRVHQYTLPYAAKYATFFMNAGPRILRHTNNSLYRCRWGFKTPALASVLEGRVGHNMGETTTTPIWEDYQMAFVDVTGY